MIDKQIPSEVVDIVSLGQNHSVITELPKQDTVNIIKNIEIALQQLDVGEAAKNEIRRKITSSICSESQKKKHISAEDRKFANKLKKT